MEYDNDFNFKKISCFLEKEEHKYKLYKLYLESSEEGKKLLYLLMKFKPSREEYIKWFDKDATITAKGLRNYVMNECNLFDYTYKFRCQNNDCKYYFEYLESDNKIYNKCPECSGLVLLANKTQLNNMLKVLYLNYFDFYLLSEFDKTMYLIYNSFNNKYYLKSSDEALSNFLYIKLLENKCLIDKLMRVLQWGDKNIKTKIINYLKENYLIKSIDNLNFLPKNVETYIQENKKYFNLYQGNKYLNKIVPKINLDFKSTCPNIYELMYNLTGHNEEGINYLINVLSMIIQEPHIKTKQLIIFYGEEASGKGTFYDLILFPLFEGYITKILGKKIKSTFNNFMSKNLILVLEEVKADKDEEDTLKELVTEDKILINPKGLPERYENSYLTIFGFSNEQNPINAGKRRGVYFRSRTLGGTTEKAPEFRKRYEKEIPKEFEDFITILKNKEYNRVEVMKGIETEAKQQVLDANKTMIERFYDEMTNYPNLEKFVARMLIKHSYELQDLTGYIHKYEDLIYIQADYLLILYNQYLKENKMSVITLNRFSQFWQLLKINKENKKQWRRLTNSSDDRKSQYVNLELINKQIKEVYEKDD